MRLLLDHNVPKGVRAILPGHEVVTAYEMGWSAVANGRLLAAAELSGFEALLTGDRNLAYQQNLAGRKIALVVLSTTHWPTIRDNALIVMDAVERASAETYVNVLLPRPPLGRQRPPPDGSA